MKKYNIIYADPPWPVKLISRKVRPKQLDMPYKIMSFDAICNLPIQNICNDSECHLFLWTTHKWLPKAFNVVDCWGFKYHCAITWNKTYGFTPFSFMWSTEFLLYGQLKNKWRKPLGIGKYKTCYKHKPLGHSVKPNLFREVVMGFCGDLPRIELFAREKVPGWDVWGNEVESDIDLMNYIDDD